MFTPICTDMKDAFVWRSLEQTSPAWQFKPMFSGKLLKPTQFKASSWLNPASEGSSGWRQPHLPCMQACAQQQQLMMCLGPLAYWESVLEHLLHCLVQLQRTIWFLIIVSPLTVSSDFCHRDSCRNHFLVTTDNQRVNVLISKKMLYCVSEKKKKTKLVQNQTYMCMCQISACCHSGIYLLCIVG